MTTRFARFLGTACGNQCRYHDGLFQCTAVAAFCSQHGTCSDISHIYSLDKTFLMTVRVQEIEFFRIPMRTRFPFHYGIIRLTELSHLLVRVTIEYQGRSVQGMSADGLAPKWFTKNPQTTTDEDQNEMLTVVRRAANTALALPEATSFFDWWNAFYQQESAVGLQDGSPPLLTGLGISLIERAVLDAVCRSLAKPFHSILLDNDLNIDLGAVRPQLSGVSLRDILPPTPGRSIAVRHTVGLSDPLDNQDIDESNRLNDGLPQTLEDSIKHYGLTHFKIKLSGQLETDRERLQRIFRIIQTTAGPHARFTVDANENYPDISTLREHWTCFLEDPQLGPAIRQGLLFVEQPVIRDNALTDTIAAQLAEWPDAPAIIIDESDADLSCLPQALQLGYSGTSHKNCKGVVKGLINAATIHASQTGSTHPLIMSAEDLANVPPIALPQDLTVVASLGLQHVERNGHHYFAGLSILPAAEQQRTAQAYPDLFSMVDDRFPAMHIRDGQISLNSVTAAPFGLHEHPDTSSLESWDF
jgi:hypothetical protein